MSEQTIYNALRAGGLSPAGTCAMMGNMYCESALKSDIVETRSPLGGADYTYNVDHGIIPAQTFINDRYGYGLCQWTYPTRKKELLEFAQSQGVSVGNAQMQCTFCIHELKRDYPSLYKYLCETDDLPKATERICSEFERPAVNNFAARINAAQKYFNALAGMDTGECTDDSCLIETKPIKPAPIPAGEMCWIQVRILRKGDKGRDVFLLQNALTDIGIDCGVPDGDFGKMTEGAVRELQKSCELNPDGIVDQDVWKIIFQ